MSEEKEVLLTAISSSSPKPSPQTYSRSSSPEYGSTKASFGPEDDLPTNVSTEAQLALLPEFCLSGNKERPLRHVFEKGDVATYALNPMFYSVIFILLVELLERFSFYGVNYTQTSFLTGAYDEKWNAGMSPVAASTYVSISTAVAYTMPFVGAFLSDSLLGEYWAMLFGIIFLYLPGLLLILFSTVRGLLGETFNNFALALGLLVLWPTGTGVVKSIVNVFGAKQFHPLLQSSLIESYYVNFYMCINIGALFGGIVVPLVAQYDITLAYTYPAGMLCIGLVLFLLGTPRYIRQRPEGDLFSKNPKSSNVDFSIGLGTVFRISVLIIPFNIAYSQMATTFIIQGNAMKKAFGFIDAACMNNADAIAVLFFGWFIGAYCYPELAKRGIKIPTTYKFAIGSGLGALSIAWAMFMEYKIHSTYYATGAKVNIMWQSMAYVLIGAGEIFAVSAAYEAAFTAAPPESKVLASAVNLFCVGGLPNVLCIFLYQACEGWFRNAKGKANISRVEDYATAKVGNYFLVLLLISLVGVVVNLIPSVRDYVASVEEKATEMVKTPVMKRPLRHKRTISQESFDVSDEDSPMLRVKRHQAYLKYGSGPVLYKQGSMRAGPSMSRNKEGLKPKKALRKSMVGKLYRTKRNLPQVVMNAEGKPLTAGKVYKRQESL